MGEIWEFNQISSHCRRVSSNAHLFFSYLSDMKSLWSCLVFRFGSHSPSHVFEPAKIERLALHTISRRSELQQQNSQSSFPRLLRNSTSSFENLAIEMDFTRCAGLRPRLPKQKQTFSNRFFVCDLIITHKIPEHFVQQKLPTGISRGKEGCYCDEKWADLAINSRPVTHWWGWHTSRRAPCSRNISCCHCWPARAGCRCFPDLLCSICSWWTRTSYR